MIHKIEKPKGTFYSDYLISMGNLWAIFEHDSRRTCIKVCETDKTINDWKAFDVQETKTHLFIDLKD